MRRVSIQDIANRANVSHSTVSRALRGHPRISSTMRLRITQLAHEMGYTPNAIAQSLQQQQSNTIGVVVSDVADPFWGEVIKGVEAVVGEHHKALLLSSARHDAQGQLQAIEVFAQRRVDGIVIADAQLQAEHLERISAIGIPTVFINSQMSQAPHGFHHVSIDNTMGGALAAHHLLEHGHRYCAYIGTSKRPASHQQRLGGFRDVLVAHGARLIALVDDTPHHDDLTVGYHLAQALPPHITGVFCYNDQVALGALSALRMRGRHIPADLSIIGFDDIGIAKHSWPPLSSIAQPKNTLGEVAMRTLLQLLAGLPGHNHVLVPHLVVRQSSCAMSTIHQTKEFGA